MHSVSFRAEEHRVHLGPYPEHPVHNDTEQEEPDQHLPQVCTGPLGDVDGRHNRQEHVDHRDVKDPDGVDALPRLGHLLKMCIFNSYDF